MKLPISAIVVSFNVGHLLDNCLAPLEFCDELVVVDLESTDNSVEIAKKYVTRIISHKWVPIGEIIVNEINPTLKHDWILATDPDEVVSQQLIDEIKSVFPTIPSDVGIIEVPWIYYFKNKMLNGTRWGGTEKAKQYLLNRNKVVFVDTIHVGRKLIQGFKTFSIKYKRENIIKHYWMVSYKSLYEKHKRYLPLEGDRLQASGLKYSFSLHLKYTLASFKNCFFINKGYKDGFTGFFLSCFWMWYVYNSWISLKKFERSLINN